MLEKNFRVEDYAEDAKSVEWGVKMHLGCRFSELFTNADCR